MDQAIRDQIAGVLRIAIPVLLTFLTGKNIVSAESIGTITNAIVDIVVAAIVIASMLWSFHSNKAVSQIDRVSQLPSVTKVVADPEISKVELKDNPKVVAS